MIAQPFASFGRRKTVSIKADGLQLRGAFLDPINSINASAEFIIDAADAVVLIRISQASSMLIWIGATIDDLFVDFHGTLLCFFDGFGFHVAPGLT